MDNNMTFFLDGENALDYGIRLQRPISITGAMPVVRSVQVPGRNGNLTIPTGSYANRKGEARCYILRTSVQDAVAAASAWMLSGPGYRRLGLSCDPAHFWKARIVNGPEVNDRMRTLNPFKIKLDLMPQRFLVAGDQPETVAKSGEILYNHYGLPALPLIKVSGSGAGQISVGSSLIKIKRLQGDLYLDSETQNAYTGNKNLNADIYAPDFPVLTPGENPITFSGGVKKIEIIPRWADL